MGGWEALVAKLEYKLGDVKVDVRTFLRYIGKLLSGYTASHPRRKHASIVYPFV
jgi:hypothetical protein